MQHAPYSGHIELICGSMFSGKTEELMRRLKRAQIARQKIQVFKPAIDVRYSETHVQSHDANRIASVSIQHSSEVLKHIEDNTRVVGIDEAQFLDPGIVDVVNKLAYRGVRVVVAGLDLDSFGKPFGPMPELLAIAESVTKLTAVCTVCGGPATRSQRFASQSEAETHSAQVVVGASEMYEPRCRFHHEPHPLPMQDDLLGFRRVVQSPSV